MQDRQRADELLRGLTPSQEAATTSRAAPLCILASAGAGKTRVLTRRIAYRVHMGTADASHTLALTFTRKAAGELQSRLHQLGLREQVAAGTFHSLAASQLHRWWADRRQTPPALLDRKARLLAPLAATRRSLAGIPVADLAGHIEWAKARLVSPDAFEESVDGARELPASLRPADIASLYARYEDEKARRGLVDFDDLLARCADAIERDPTFASAQRWLWRHVYVDEFQDLNPLQHRLLLAWLGPSTDLCVVGDPHQAVYGWNGADPGLLAEIPERWPQTEVLHLDDNHRCTPQIVAAAAAVLGPSGSRLRSAGRDGPAPDVRAFPSETAEAAGIASGIRRANASGRRWSSLAVLTRTNAQLVPIQRALAAAGIPSWAPSQAALLEDPGAREVVAELRNNPRRPMQVVVADLAAHACEAEDAGVASTVASLAELARSYHRQHPDGVAAAWLAWLPAALRDDSGGTRSADAVALCSFHRAKGLEWDAVWVAGLEQGLVPIGRAASPGATQEERRLLYVALTRASAELHCSWARQRTFGSRPVPRGPSPWLDLICTGGATPDGGDAATRGRPAGATGDTSGWREQLREQRRRLGESGPGRGGRGVGPAPRVPEGWPAPDPSVVSALRIWRSETARASGVPAYVVLHDATLSAVASLRPRTVEELLSVPGLGPVKAGRYGADILSLVGGRAATA
ncbi:MAG: ATP-dependent DNA helicase UvrD2 [Acidimicrobiales bacterium]